MLGEFKFRILCHSPFVILPITCRIGELVMSKQAYNSKKKKLVQKLDSDIRIGGGRLSFPVNR